MERPQSEGLLSSSSPRDRLLRRHPHRSESHRRHRKHAPHLSQSCNLIFNSSNEAQESAVDALQVVQAKDDSYDHPRRPKTTPKPRVERLLVGPGKAHIMHAAQPSPMAAHDKSTSFFMTHLPDSPPRYCHRFPSSSSDEESDTAEDHEGREHTRKIRSLSIVNPIEAPRKPSTNEAIETTGATLEPPQHHEPSSESPIESLRVSSARASLTSNDDEVQQDAEVEFVSSSFRKVEDENKVYAPHEEEGVMSAESHDCARKHMNSLGPLCVDVITQRSTSPSATTHPQRILNEVDEQAADDASQGCDDPALPSDDEEDTMEQNANASLPFVSDSAAPCVDGDDDDDEYTRSLEARKKLQNAEGERERLRDELQSYVASLTSRKGDDGAQWLEFPKNYEHVLSLMSERDLRDEVAVSSNSGLTSVSNSSQRSWSHVLLQTGLAKQQAFGTLTDGDNENDAKSSLAAKIALKMARVRQLDAILEEKLGKHLYSASNGRQGSKFGAKKPKPVAPSSVQVRNQEPEPSATRSGGIGKTFAAQPNPNLSGGGLQHQRSDISIISASRQEEQPFIGTKPQNGSNFVERNKKVIACGMKPVLSQDEETRLNRLLCDVDTDATASTSSMESPSVAKLDRTIVEERNEFAMSASEKKRIEELIVEKRGTYQSSLLGPFDDDGNDDSDIIADTPTAAASNSNTVNIIQATKKERLRKQRLDRIDQELAFLNQSGGCLTIVADDDEAEAFILNDGETDSVFDGTMSEHSYRTATSMATSVCSLRSGVISRRQFNEFLAAETRKLSSAAGTNDSIPNKASPEEIQRLVSSLSHLMTSRPVA